MDSSSKMITLEFGKPQTELERARAHMRACQEDLRRARIWGNTVAWRDNIHKYEEKLLAALSWVWDAQGRQQLASAIPLDVKVTIDVAAFPRFNPGEIEKILGL